MNEGYFSHIPLLAAAVLNTTGPVLELGAGSGSTLLLHGLCGAMRRSLTTLESDYRWLSKFMSFARPWHKLISVNSFENLPVYEEKWGLAFVDHGIMKQREASIRALQHVPMLVVHDTCHPWLYGYEPILSEFAYRWNWQVKGPMTSVVSNSLDVSTMFLDIGL